MQATLKIKEILHVIETLDPQTFDEKADNFTHLNKIVSEGNTTFLTNNEKIFQSYPLVSILTFGQTFENGFEFSGTVKENELRVFQAKVENKKSDADDEIIEVKYIQKPTKWAEVSNNLFAIVVTNSKKIADFCELIELSYYYDTKSLSEDEILSKLADQKVIDLLILHNCNPSSLKQEELLEGLNKAVEVSLNNANFVKILFTSFAKNVDSKLIFQKHLKQLEEDEKKKQLLMDLIPNQTWQYNRGELVHQSGEGFSLMLLATYKKNQNRTDSIKKLSDYSNVNNYSSIGGNIIVSSGFLREIMFELGKLPKFGA